MAALAESMKQGVWFDQSKVEEAEYSYQMFLAHGKKAAAEPQPDVNKNKGDGNKTPKSNQPKQQKSKPNQPKSNTKEEAKSPKSGGLAKQIAEARQKIKDSITSYTPSDAAEASSSDDLTAEVAKLRLENDKLQKVVQDMTARFAALETRLSALEGGKPAPAPAAAPKPQEPAPATNGVADDEDSDDDDLFGSDSEEDDEEAERIKQERLKAYAEKKAKKPGPIAKSNIILDVKPWDDETDMVEVEKLVRTIECDGLKWGASKMVKIAYGITKLQIMCVVEDDKVGTDFLEEKITGFEDHVQSMDIVAFNKI